MSKTSQPQGLSGLEVIQLFYPKRARLDTSAVGSLIGKQDRSIRNDICRGKFPIAHFKDGGSKAAKLWFDVRDVAAYLDAQRDKPARGRPTKAQQLAAQKGCV